MPRPLFRQQAMEHFQHRLHGDVLVLPKFAHSSLGLLLLVWIIAVLIWLGYSQYTRHETVQGWLEPAAGVAKHYAPEYRGIIAAVHVREGQEVLAGQALLTINGDHQISAEQSVEQALLNEYQQQLSSAVRALQQQQQIHALQIQSSQQQIEAATSDLKQINTLKQIAQQRLRLISNRIETLISVRQQGHITASKTDALQEQRLAMQIQVQALIREQQNQANRILQLGTEAQLLPHQYNTAREQIHHQVSELTQQITKVNGQRKYTVVASRDGVINNLHVKLGQSVTANQALLSIVPLNFITEAQLLVPIRAAGLLFIGQHIDIRYHAFPHQKFGLYSGELSNISSALVLPNEMPNVPIAIQEPMYLVKAKLNSSVLTGIGQPVNLKPGMTFYADIKLEEHSLIEWIMQPIVSLKSRL